MGICKACGQRPVYQSSGYCATCKRFVEGIIRDAERKSGGCLLGDGYEVLREGFCRLVFEYVGETEYYTHETCERIGRFRRGAQMQADRDYKDYRRSVDEKYSGASERARVENIDLNLSYSQGQVERRAGRTDAQQRDWDRNWDVNGV